MRPDVVGLSGGAKRLYMNVHKEEILTFYAGHGLYQTMQEFNIGFETLQNFIRENVVNNNRKSDKQLTDKDKLTIRLSIAESAIREVASRTRSLESGYEKFVPAVARSIAEEWIIPGMIDGLQKRLADKSASLPEVDPLELGKSESKNHTLYVMSGDDDASGEDLT